MSDTPRTNDFIRTLPPMRLNMADFRDRDALLRVDRQIRDLMIAWATFARQLEGGHEPDEVPHTHIRRR